jgi:hypothetical protein
MITTLEYNELKDKQPGNRKKLEPPTSITYEEVMLIKEYEKYPDRINVYQINHSELSGTLFIEFGHLGDFEDGYIVDAEYMEVGTIYTIKIISMPKPEFENLGEFECFE